MSAVGLQLVGELALETIRAAGWEAQFVGGMTLGADPVAYAIALASQRSPPVMDAFTVRKEVKHHGSLRQVEGCLTARGRVVVVEDVLTTGRSSLRAIETLLAEDAVIIGVLAVVDRGEGGSRAVEEAGFPIRTLVSAADLGIAENPSLGT